MCAGLCRTYWTTFVIAEKNRNVSCPMHEWDHSPFFEFINPPPRPPGADGHHRGRRQSADIVPTQIIFGVYQIIYSKHNQNYYLKLDVWCGSVQALLRYRSKTAKMQKFPIDSHSNKNFIFPFFRPPGAANYQKGRRHIRNQSTPACKIWRELARGLSRNHWQKNEQNSKSNTSASVKLTQTRHSHSK